MEANSPSSVNQNPTFDGPLPDFALSNASISAASVPWYTTSGCPLSSTTLLSPNHRLNHGESVLRLVQASRARAKGSSAAA